MPRKGRLLEVLVRSLQDFLVPEGITVRSPEEFHREGKKIGEIDITLRGHFGSSEIFIGIECRDRPARSGPEGIAWISEIKGKQRLLRVDKMIAVSTTGFSEQAIVAAREMMIDLITARDVEDVKPEAWFTDLSWGFVENLYCVSGRIDLGVFEADLAELLRDNEQMAQDTPCLRKEGSYELLSVPQFIEPDVTDMFSKLHPSPDGTVLLKGLEYAKVQAVLRGREFEIEKMIVPVSIWCKLVHAKSILNVFERPGDSGEIIAMSGVCRLQTHRGTFRIVTLLKRNTRAPQNMDIKFEFLTDDFKPLNPQNLFPQGFQIMLYGEPKVEPR